MNRYLKGLDTVLGARTGIARISDVLGAESTALEKPSEMSTFLRDIRATAPPDVKDGLGTVAGAIAGTLLVPTHRFLGAVGGASLGRNVPALFDSNLRPIAVRNMAQTGTAIVGSLIAGGKNGGVARRLGGFLAGWLLGGVVVYFGWPEGK